jgi:hypothetical protein
MSAIPETLDVDEQVHPGRPEDVEERLDRPGAVADAVHPECRRQARSSLSGDGTDPQW